jgi:hypothetical protein
MSDMITESEKDLASLEARIKKIEAAIAFPSRMTGASWFGTIECAKLLGISDEKLRDGVINLVEGFHYRVSNVSTEATRKAYQFQYRRVSDFLNTPIEDRSALIGKLKSKQKKGT